MKSRFLQIVYERLFDKRNSTRISTKNIEIWLYIQILKLYEQKERHFNQNLTHWPILD